MYKDTDYVDKTYSRSNCHSKGDARGAGNNGRRGVCTAEVNDNLDDGDGTGMDLSISGNGDERRMDISS